MKRLTVVALAASFALLPLTAHAGDTITYWGTFFSEPGSTTPVKSPTPITLPGNVIQVGTSNSTQYALLDNGQVWAWGWGNNGQLGDASTANSFTTPVQVEFPAGVVIASLATDVMPYNAGLAISTNGNAWGWGDGAAGIFCLGKGKTSHYLTPVELPFTDVTSLAGASAHASYDAGGTVYSCGTNSVGQLGDGSTAPSDTPVAVKGLANVGAVSLVASSVDEGALLPDGAFYDWGANGEDQIGNGMSGGYSDVPILVPLPLPATQVVAGGMGVTNGSTLAMLSDGSLWAWGCDNAGQLGDGRTVNEASPIEFRPPTGVTYTLLAESGVTSYGVTASGAVYSWGQGARGQIGNGHLTKSLTPVMVVASGVTQISATAQEVTVLP
jgi:hypothetical protein